MKINNKKIYIVAFICVFALFSAVYAASFNGKINKSGFKKYTDNEIIVKFKKNISSLQQISSVSSMGDSRIKSLRKDMVHIKLKKDDTVENAIERYKNNPDVEYAQPNYIYRISAVPNDPSYGQEWGA